jgi:hypothetical protein
MAVTTFTRRGERTDARVAAGARLVECEAGLANATEEDVFLVEYEGAVLGKFERNGYDDSDFLAVVWTGEVVTTVEYATTRGWTYYNGATVDATDEVKALAAEWMAATGIDRYRREDVAAALDVAVGKRVRVTKGRKVPVGTEGTICWLGDDNYSRCYYNNNGGRALKRRVGLKLEDGTKVFLAAGNVTVLDAAQYLTSEADLVEKQAGWAAGLIRSGNFVSAYRGVEAALLSGRFYLDAPEVTDEVVAEMETARQ